MGRVVKEHVYRTHGQSQSGEGLRVGAEDGGQEVVAEKWRTLYMNNNKKEREKEYTV